MRVKEKRRINKNKKNWTKNVGDGDEGAKLCNELSNVWCGWEMGGLRCPTLTAASKLMQKNAREWVGFLERGFVGG